MSTAVVVRPRHRGGAGWSALDFAVAVQFVRQGQHLQARAFEAAQVQVVVCYGIGGQHRQQLAARRAEGGQYHFTHRGGVGRREDLGAGRWRVFFTITLPLTLPGIIVGTVLAFARSLGEFGATITFVSNIPGETRTIPSAMYTLIQTPGGEGAAARLCIISIVLALVSLLVSEWLARLSRERMGK